jgi:hypothetical protein
MSANGFSLADLYLAYRKAKAEAFYENTHFHALAFSRYEQHLDKNPGAILAGASTSDTTNSREGYGRDVVRVRGGLHDYFVVASLGIGSLRNFQRYTPRSSKGRFKPVPIGYEMSKIRGQKD